MYLKKLFLKIKKINLKRLFIVIKKNEFKKIIPGNIVFKLYDTYGFPVDLTLDIAKERGFLLDMEGFEEEMLEQKEKARSSSQFKGGELNLKINPKSKTLFTGYEDLSSRGRILEIFVEGKTVSEISEGEKGAIILDRTPFYAESGGQVGDKGVLSFANNVFIVDDTKKNNEANVHYGKVLSGAFGLHDFVDAKVEKKLRKATICNHSATHLLHSALRYILGSHVVQKGSYVDPYRLRFDFTHNKPLTKKEMTDVEKIVNEKIRENTKITTEVMPIKEAHNKGALALFGEKYDANVRVLNMGYDQFSKELCGGTHANMTGDLGFFKIISQSSVGSGIRRIEALVGESAFLKIKEDEDLINKISLLLKVDKSKLEDKINQLHNKIKALEADVKKANKNLSKENDELLIEKVVDVNGVKVLSSKLENLNSKDLREYVDKFKNKLKSAVVVFACVTDDKKINIAAGVTKDKTKILSAGKLVNYIANQVGGKGGGRADFAMAGGNKVENLAKALDSVYQWVKDNLSLT